MSRPIFNSKWKRFFWLIVWALVLVVYLFPFAWMVMTGFRNPVDTYSWPPKFIFTPTLQGFYYLFEVRNFQSYLGNSLIVSLLSTFLVILLATPAAYASAHLNLREKGFLLSLLVGRMIPPIALVVPVYLLASRWHLLDTYQVLIAINVARMAASRARTGAVTLAPADATVEALRKLVEDNFRKERHLEFYAKSLSMTADRLNDHVKRATGVTAGHLIRQRVLTEAKRQLVFTNQPIHEIAYDLAFSDPSHFARFFRKQTGTTPHEFRAGRGG